MHSMQSSNFNATPNPIGGQPHFLELRQREESMLAVGALSDPLVSEQWPTGRFRRIWQRFRPVGGGWWGWAGDHDGSVAGVGARVVREMRRLRAAVEINMCRGKREARRMPGLSKSLAC
jgi:hypothetical protein